MLRKTENLAWFILVLSFALCITIGVATPLGIRWYILNNTRSLKAMLQLRSGNVTYWTPRSSSPILITENAEIQMGSRIMLTENADVLLLFYLPDEPDSPIITLQLYGSTDLIINQARTPRYNISELSNSVQLSIAKASNMQPSVTDNSRPTQLIVRTPHGSIHMDE
ncbi:MAG: hypothetical protein P1S60_06135, partial [Anaerolineae bacterium]|nr:hypothetical protein [Anaerolineae bacterium]